jgi:hypothetical protein
LLPNWFNAHLSGTDECGSYADLTESAWNFSMQRCAYEVFLAAGSKRGANWRFVVVLQGDNQQLLPSA